jgi:hypothetical protein
MNMKRKTTLRKEYGCPFKDNVKQTNYYIGI